MGRMALVVLALGGLIWLLNVELPSFDMLDGKLWLVGIFPSVYLLGLLLLRE